MPIIHAKATTSSGSADLSAYVKKTDLGIYAQKVDLTAKAEIGVIKDPLPAPIPIYVKSIAGATIATGEVGSALVDEGRVHAFARTSTPPAPNTWTGSLTVSPTLGACKLRFGITSALTGTIEVLIDGGAPLTAMNTGFGWSGTTAAIQAFQETAFTWFEVAIAQSSNPQSVSVTIPTGRGLLPCLYAPDAITSLTPTEPTGMTLRSMPSGEAMDYRPNAFAKQADVTSLSGRVQTLETRSPIAVPPNTKSELAAITGVQFQQIGCVEDNQIYRWESKLVDRLHTEFPSDAARGALPIGTVYPGKVGGGWVPENVSYVQDSQWIQAEDLGHTPIYGCRLTTESINAIVFEFCDPDDKAVFSSVSYAAADIATWTDSSYWGGKTKFDTLTLPNAKSVKVVTCIRDNSDILLCTMRKNGSLRGWVRNVKVNGIPADVLAVTVSSLKAQVG